TLPTPIWPRPDYQSANRPAARQLVQEREAMRQAALSNGFTQSSLDLTGQILNTWEAGIAASGVFWPTNPMSQWILEKVMARTPTNLFALGLVTANEGQSGRQAEAFESQLPGEGFWVSGWELLGSAILSKVKANMWKVLAPMIGLVLLSLGLAFRRWPEVLLS